MAMFKQFYGELWDEGVVPVVIIDKVGDAAPLAHALVAGGLNSAEVTFRTPCAAEAIAAMRAAEPGMLVGAGTVVNIAHPSIIACGGTWMVKPSLFADGDFSRVEQLAREAADIVRSIRRQGNS